MNSSLRFRNFKLTIHASQEENDIWASFVRYELFPFLPISSMLPVRKNVSVAAAYPTNKSCRKDRRSTESSASLTLLSSLSSSLVNVTSMH